MSARKGETSRGAIFLSVSAVSAVALMLATQGAADALLSQPVFLVREVEVSWPGGETARVPSRFRLHPPTSVFRVDLESLSRAFSRRFPLSEVERIDRVLPNRLRAVMKSRRVVAQVQAGKGFFPVSDEGMVVAAGRPTLWPDLPLVEIGGAPVVVRAGGRVAGSGFGKCTDLLAAIQRDGGIAGHKVKRIRVTGSDLSLVLDSEAEVRFSGDQVWTGWQRLAQLIAQKPGLLDWARYVDLRFDHLIVAEKPVVKKKKIAKAKKSR